MTPNETVLDTALYFLIGLLLTALSAVLLTVADFNAFHILVNNGVVGDMVPTFDEWCAYVLAHRDEVRGFFRAYWWLDLSRGACAAVAGSFAAPTFSILLLWDRPGLQRCIVVGLAVLCLLALVFLCQFYGANTGNGGYDGGECMMLRFLYALFGVLAMSYALGRAAMRCHGRLRPSPARAG